MKEEIISFFDNDIVGFTKLENYPELEEKYKVQKSLGIKTPFQKESDIKFKLKDYYPNYNSIIVIGVQYQLSKNFDESTVFLSSSSWGSDYHKVLKEKLERVRNYLKERGYKSEIFVDNNEFDERYIAFKAGMGFYGKNHLLINEQLGTNFFIGLLFTDAIFIYDSEVKATCFGCDKCIEACPTNALGKSVLDAGKCLSYLTQKKDLSSDESSKLNNCIYGCDICTNICPHNVHANKTTNFSSHGIEFIEVKNYKHLTNSEWKKIYGNLSCAWRGRNVFERNINIYKEKLEKKW